jgi:hypothetical protein
MMTIISTAAQAAYSVATYIIAYASTVGRNVEVMEHSPRHAEKLISKVRSRSPFD